MSDLATERGHARSQEFDALWDAARARGWRVELSVGDGPDTWARVGDGYGATLHDRKVYRELSELRLMRDGSVIAFEPLKDLKDLGRAAKALLLEMPTP